ncbi:sulfatase-like hydrolase/transferase [Adhaeretor mobilis]|uniref:Arylsulfatase n=1 Tax=Adhaeretor mobilis TaxID=1930276 RepID=A0A517MW73_9BACT|nr:sulfatase-like hydrolase/transferase [Adhaeretor mobilis]QDS99119.1 Arylsulfatase [Adhaeretor mobilis]
MKACLRLSCFLLLVVGLAQNIGLAATFKKIQLSDQFFCEGATFTDVDRDGSADIVAGPYWYAGPEFIERTELYSPQPFDIVNYSDNFLTFAYDFSGDGWDDILVVGYPGTESFWYQNPQGKSGPWERHLALAVTDNESPTLTDVTGDGVPELVCMSGGRIGYAVISPDTPTHPWQFHAVSPKRDFQRFTHGLGVGDINGDGRMDLLEKDGWWEQPTNEVPEGEPWTFHKVKFSELGGAQMFAYDLDDDGDNDVVTSKAAHAYGLAWFENTGKDNEGEVTFCEHSIMGEHAEEKKHGVAFSQLHAVELADVNGDGIDDIITGKRFWAHKGKDPGSREPAVLYWFETVRNGRDVSFLPHRVDSNSGVGTQVVVDDLTGDRLLDIVVGNKKGTFLFTQIAAEKEIEVSSTSKPIETHAISDTDRVAEREESQTASYDALSSCKESQGSPTSDDQAPALPNIVVIFVDDLGYADIGPYGAVAYPTPHLDRMAGEGRVFTDFVSATAVCSASRAALLTGCYPERVSILGALYPNAKIGLNSKELTLAELCKQQGYATAIFGKWHLGHLTPFLPLQHGFDEYFGLPYSNDMWPLRPGELALPAEGGARKKRFPNLPLFEGNRVVKEEVTAEDQAQLTTMYTERSVDFINRNANRPFFLYVPHTMVHVPLFVSSKFQGKSGAGLFGDVVMEIDWSVGQILDAIHQNEIEENTLVIFTSDNGPWLNFGNHAGSAKPLREGKGTMFEGGYREPCIMRWPGKIPAGTQCDELASTIDLLPTVAKLIGAELPPERTIDGEDIWPLMSGRPNAESPHEIFYCYYGGELHAVRNRRWKLHFPHPYRSLEGKPGGIDGIPTAYSRLRTGVELYDLKSDIGESKNVANLHPKIVARFTREAESARAALGDKLTNRVGAEIRPHGTAE